MRKKSWRSLLFTLGVGSLLLAQTAPTSAFLILPQAITFSEFPVGTHITSRYGVWTFTSNLGFAEIGVDSSQPTTPVLVATDFPPNFPGAFGGMDSLASFYGPIAATNTQRMAAVQLDVGFINNPGSVVLSAFDKKGVLLSTATASQRGINTLQVADPLGRIASISLNAVHDLDFGRNRGPFEFRGYTVDNFTFRPSLVQAARDLYQNVIDPAITAFTLGRILGESALGPAAPPLFVAQAIEIVADRIKSKVEDLLINLALDPFDPRFKDVFQPVQYRLPPVNPGDFFGIGPAAALTNFQNTHLEALSALQALFVSLERLSSALTVNDTASALLQLGAIQQYLDLVSQRAAAASTAADTMIQVLNSLNLNLALTLDDVIGFQQLLSSSGFPQSELDLFGLVGFSDTDIANARDTLLQFSGSGLPASLVGVFEQDKSYYQGLSLTPVPQAPTLLLTILALFIYFSWFKVRSSRRSHLPSYKREIS